MELKSKADWKFTDGDVEVTGVVRIATGAEKLRHGATIERAGKDAEEVFKLSDDAMAEYLVECSATLDGQTFGECEDRTRYIGLLPMEVKLAAMNVVFGLGELSEGEEGNSEPGRESS